MTAANSSAARALLKKIKYRLRDAWWDLYGSRLEMPGMADQPRTALFLCHGNICRSPFAERIARRLCGEAGAMIQSAGIEVTAANPSPPAAQEAAMQLGIDLTDHRSQPLTRQMLADFAAVFVMEVSQRTQLKREFPFAAGKIHLLPLFEDRQSAPAGGYEKYNIRDPFGRPADDFLRCYRRISRCVDGIFKG